MKKFLLIILIFTGCSIKTAIKHDPLYEKTLTYTQRGQIINSLETKAMLDAVYLNPLYPTKFNTPTFLIGIYSEIDNSLNNSEFTLILNNQKPFKISKEIPRFIIYKNFPFYNKWMNYYIVEFNNTQKPYNLIYKSKHWGEVKFIF